MSRAGIGGKTHLKMAHHAPHSMKIIVMAVNSPLFLYNQHLGASEPSPLTRKTEDKYCL